MPYPIPSLMIPDSVLQDHNFKHFCSGGMHEFRLGDEVTYALIPGHGCLHWAAVASLTQVHPCEPRSALLTLW